MRTKHEQFMLAVLALAAGSTAALAVPRESVTLQGVASIGGPSTPQNEIRSQAFIGGYTAQRIRITGTIESLDPFTWLTDAHILVYAPGVATPVATIQPFNAGFEFDTATLTDAVFDLSAPVAAAGTWQFRFYETFWDADPFADATWSSITFTLDDEGSNPPATLTPVSNVYTEIEDNDSKVRANRILALENSQSITGVTTGAGTAGGLASRDYFLIRTAAAPLGIYRHRLVINTLPGLEGHTGSLRGLVQTLGVIDATTDADIQGSTVGTTPPRLNQWYGFGKQEQIFYRITGQSTTTAAYTIAHTVTSVTPTEAPRGYSVGSLVFNSSGQGHQTDTDLWIYDSQLNAIAAFGDDDSASLLNGASRFEGTFAAGTYYLAIAPYNLANNLPSVYAQENFRNGEVTDFADVALCDSIDANAAVSLSITDSSGASVVPLVREGPFDVVWVRFVVGQATCPADLDDGTNTGTPDGAVTIDDLIFFLTAFEAGSLGADLDDGTNTGTHDNAVTIDDLIFFLVHFEAGC